MTHVRDNIRWKLYLRSGSIEIWEGRPVSPPGLWVTWEVRNAQSGESRPCQEHSAMLTFNEMLISLDHD